MTPQSVTYSANGNCTTFGFDFPVFEPADLEVLLNGAVQTSGFTLLGASSPDGGAVRFAAAPSAGTSVTLRRTGKVQVSGSDAPGFLEAKVLAGDHISVTKTSDSSGEHLAIATDINPADFATAAQGAKADSALQSADIGTTIQAYDADLGWVAANLTAAGKALLDDADASAQRTTLGLGSAATLDVDTDGTLATNSDTLLPSEKAVKTYVDGKIAAIFNGTDSPNSFDFHMAQTYLISAIAGGKGVGLLSGGAYDPFSIDTIGANSTGQGYEVGHYYTNANKGSRATPAMTGYTTPSGTVIESSHYLTNFEGWRAFDGQDGNAVDWSHWNAGATSTCWLGYDFGANRSIVSYGVISRRDAVENGWFASRCPRNWSFEGWNGSTWVVLDTQQNQSWTTYGQTKTYAIANPGYYSKYRINISANNGDSYTEFGELVLTQTASSADMTLVSSALSPAPATAPSHVKILVLWKDVSNSASLNTDFTAAASRDGTTWTAGSLADTGYTFDGYKMLWAAIDVSGQPSGTTVKYRLQTHNAKEQQVRGVALLAK